MKDDYAEIEKIANNGYNLEFGTILENSFNNYKKIAGIGGVAFILVSIISITLMFAVIGAIYGFSNFSQTLIGFNPELMDQSTLIGFVIFTVLLGAIMSPINAGFFKMANLADQNKNFGVENVFEYYKSIHFKELFIAALIVGFLGGGINYILESLGIMFVGNIITYAISFLTLFATPLIIFANLKATQAITLSLKLVLKNPILIFGLVVVALIFVCLGLIGFCIGMFFTIPFWYSTVYCLYKEIIPFSEKSELDEIGIAQE